MSVAVVSQESDAERRRGVQPTLPMDLRPPAAPAAVSLLAQARHGLAEARVGATVAERFTGAYRSALRAAAAVLAARGRPHRGRAKPESVWSLLESGAPEVGNWAAYFAAHSARHAAAQAGAIRGVDGAAADELLRRAGEFAAVASQIVYGRGEPHRCDGAGRRPRRRRS